MENVLHGLVGSQWEKASEEERIARVKWACKEASAHDFIESLPQVWSCEPEWNILHHR